VPLSNTQVISLLNQYYVPVYIANEDYRDSGAAPAEEKTELRRIHREAHALKLSVGSVHAYILSPEGKTIDSLHVAEAFKKGVLPAALERNAQKLGTKAGEPVVRPVAQSTVQTAPGSLTLHLTARYLERNGDDYRLVEDSGGNWSALPGEDWLVLERAQWTRLLPTGKPAVGASWEIDRAVATEILTRFYPPTENNDLKKNRLDEQSLTATAVSVQGSVVRARVDGRLKMKHPFYHKDDENFAQAKLVGFLEFDAAKPQIRSLRLVTETASYGKEGQAGQPYGVAVRSLP